MLSTVSCKENAVINFLQASQHLNVVTTDRCNRKCSFCIASKNTHMVTSSNFISLQSIEKALLFCKKQGIQTVAFTGGEPSLHPEIINIVRCFHENGLHTAIYTNYDFPEIIKELDGIVDYVFASYYGQTMPKQRDFQRTQVIITTLLISDHFQSISDLDRFIDKYRENAYLVFKTPVNVNDYCEEHTCNFLYELESRICDFMILPDGTKVQFYNGCFVKRPDLPKAFVNLDTYSYKMRLNGEISRFYSKSTEKIALIKDISLRNDLLSTHNPKARKAILKNYKHE